MKQKLYVYTQGDKSGVYFKNKELVNYYNNEVFIGTVELDVQPPEKEVVVAVPLESTLYTRHQTVWADVPLDCYDVKLTYKQKVPV